MLDLFTLLTPLVIVALLAKNLPFWCVRQGLIAEITPRHAHDTPTPHGGGILLIPVIVILGLIAVWGLHLPRSEFLTALLLASLIVAAIGLYDDKYGLAAKWRLLAHLIAVGIGLYFMPPLFDTWPTWAEKLLLLLAWGWFVNLYNFMDGLDGLATSQAIYLTLALALLFAPFKPLLLIIAGACLGFLRVNWAPAKVFMGDVGSTFLGYLIGGLLLVIVVDDTWRLVYPLFTLPLVFTADATYTLLKRILQGHNPCLPHREFWIHRAAKYGFTHAQVVEMVLAINALLFIIALAGLWLNLGIFTALIGLVVVSTAAYIFNKLERHKK